MVLILGLPGDTGPCLTGGGSYRPPELSQQNESSEPQSCLTGGHADAGHSSSGWAAMEADWGSGRQTRGESWETLGTREAASRAHDLQLRRTPEGPQAGT